MPGSISVGVTCRDIEALGSTEEEVRAFIDEHLAPAMANEIMSRRQLYMGGIQATTRLLVSPEVEARSCSVSGSITVSF